MAEPVLNPPQQPRRVPARRGRGVTLVELLVAVSIVAMLAALVLPAVQMAREAARQTQCRNNLKQLGLAAVNFEQANGRFPPGYLGDPDFRNPGELNNQWVGMLVYLLPYYEQQSVYDRLDIDLHVDRPAEPPPRQGLAYWDHPVAWQLSQWELGFLQCPSAPDGPPERHSFDMIYPLGVPGGLMLRASGWDIGQVRQGKTNYLGCSGWFGEIGRSNYDRRVGVFSIRSTMRVAQITDGTSHTLLFGEAVGTVRNAGLGDAFSWIGAATLPVGFGLDSSVSNANWNQFSSLHPGLVNFCLADGSVQAIRRQIDQSVLNAIAGRSDGEPSDGAW